MQKFVNLDKVKYEFERKTIEPGVYTLHRPSQCNLKFSKNNIPIHKRIEDPYKGKNVIETSYCTERRKLIVPGGEKIIYPAIWHKSKYEELKEKAFPLSENTEEVKLLLEERRQRAEDGEKLKKKLDVSQKPQPGIAKTNEDNSKENEASSALKRADAWKCEEFQGARIANQIILASKCHAIRDAQISEKSIITEEIINENKRLDHLMEEARLAAIEKEQQKYTEEKKKRYENINYIKTQIALNDRKKIMDTEKQNKECILMYQYMVNTEIEQLEKLKKKRERAAQLKTSLDKANEEKQMYKMQQKLGEKYMEEKRQLFIQNRKDREARLKAEIDAKKSSKQKEIDMIAQRQKAERDLREKVDYLRVLKIQEDVERQYREKERATAIKKSNNLKALQEARNKQIADVRKQMAVEISKDEDLYRNIVEKNKHDMKLADMKKKEKEDTLAKYKQEITKQINKKEHEKKEQQQIHLSEGKKITIKVKQEEALEKEVVKQKIEEMREQKIPEKYVNEVENQLRKLKYI